MDWWANCARLEANDRLIGDPSDEGDADSYMSREDFGCIFHEVKDEG